MPKRKRKHRNQEKTHVASQKVHEETAAVKPAPSSTSPSPRQATGVANKRRKKTKHIDASKKPSSSDGSPTAKRLKESFALAQYHIDRERLFEELEKAEKVDCIDTEVYHFLLQAIECLSSSSSSSSLKQCLTIPQSIVDKYSPKNVSSNNVDKNDNTGSDELENAATDPKALVPVRQLIFLIIECAEEVAAATKDEEKWKSFQLVLEWKNNQAKILSGERQEARDMKEEIENLLEDQGVDFFKIFATFEDKNLKFGSSPYTNADIKNVDVFFGKGKEGMHKHLTNMLKEKMNPLTIPRGNGYLQPDLDLVQLSSSDEWSKIFEPDGQVDRSYAIVVAGESGSGKSVFACQATLEFGFVPIYCVIDEKDRECKPTLKFPEIRKFFVLLRNAFGEDEEDILETLSAMSAGINTERNDWAAKILKRRVSAVLDQTFDNDESMGGVQAREWKKGEWPEHYRPEKVAIIIDEATDLDLTEGLISIVRDLPTMEPYKHLYQKYFQLLIVGTGLDVVRSKTVGSLPSKSSLTVLKEPNMKKLREILSNTDNAAPEDILHALEEGSFSRVTKTNARMLFRSTLPILMHHFHYVDMKDVEWKPRLRERLTALGSFGPLIDHAVRYYAGQNSIGELDGPSRQGLLQTIFLYHLCQSILTVNTQDEHKTTGMNYAVDLKSLQDQLKPNEIEREGRNIFSKGLAMRNITKTSAALKYLACYGEVCPTRRGFGSDFEELVALHSRRLLEVQGYDTLRIDLSFSWPPPATKKGYNNETLEDLNKTLISQKRKELKHLKKALTMKKRENSCGSKVAVVFMQGGARAQGGDVLVLRYDSFVEKLVEKPVASLESIQCKFHSTERRISRGWWNFLGVDVDKKTNETNCTPEDGKAAHSYYGLRTLSEVLKEAINATFAKNDEALQVQEVKIGQRTMAVTYSANDDKTSVFPKSENTRVWYREFLEPTISTFSASVGVKDDDDECSRR